MLRGDLPRLSRTTAIVTSTPSLTADPAANTHIKRSKPLKYAYEKEIVLYAHHKNLDYFSTECIYSPEAFRGSARALIKNLERVRPSAILDVVRSGEDMATLVPGTDGSCSGACASSVPVGDDDEGACGSTQGRTSGGEMASMEQALSAGHNAAGTGLETEITTSAVAKSRKVPKAPHNARTQPKRQVMGQCKRCGYLSSQDVCKACVLLEGLNKNRPKNHIEVGYEPEKDVPGVAEAMKALDLGAG